jgi:outer membrane lipoprotein-sorting protein
MKLGKLGRVVSALILLSMMAWAQQGAKIPPNSDLARVLTQMDSAAVHFRTTEATFIWDQYQKVVDETDSQKGRVYFRRAGGEIQMAADVTEPSNSPKYLLVSEGKIQLYQPRIDQVTVYDEGKNRETFESFLALGFGAGGHEMLKSFDINYLGTEKLGGINTEKLDLIPKSPRIRNTFSHITLWIDPERGISLQQQLFDPSGDYRVNRYSDIQLNQKLPDSAFKLKTTAKTKFVSHQG